MLKDEHSGNGTQDAGDTQGRGAHALSAVCAAGRRAGLTGARRGV